MKVVQFKNGMYGIRRFNWLMGYEFFDFRSRLWLPTKVRHTYPDDCEAEWAEAETAYQKMKDMGEGV